MVRRATWWHLPYCNASRPYRRESARPTHQPRSLDAWSPFSWSTRPVSRAGDFSPRRHRSQSPLDGDPRERGLHGRSHLKGRWAWEGRPAAARPLLAAGPSEHRAGAGDGDGPAAGQVACACAKQRHVCGLVAVGSVGQGKTI